MPDRTLTCCDCSQPFVFSEGEQNWYATKGFHEPKRCKPCRELKKAKMDREEADSGDRYADRGRR